MYEPDECGDERRATILTSGGSGIGAAHRDDFTRLGYTVVEIAPRPQTGPSSLNKGLLGDLTFAANDLGIAVRWLRAHADELCLNPDRIAAVGHSFSAIAALSLAYTEGELDPGDTITLPGLGSTEFPDVSPSPPPAELEAYSNRIDAVVSFAGFAVADTIDPVEPPSLLIHGRNGQAAPFALAKKTCTAATAVGVRCELLPHDDGHDLPAAHLATVAAIDDFLRHELEASTPAGQGVE